MLTLALVVTPVDPGTGAEREALFDDILSKTMARESFSPVKNDSPRAGHRVVGVNGMSFDLYFAKVRRLRRTSA